MLPRYSRPEMIKLWSEKEKFRSWLKVELYACRAWQKCGSIPKEDVDLIWEKLENHDPDVEEIHKIEQQTKHDVIAFTRSLSPFLGDEKRWVHYGLTSTDVVDTALAFRLKQVNVLIRTELVDMVEVLKKRAYEFEQTPCIGRTHGIHADITSFGMKWALWYDNLQRNLKHFDRASEEIEVGKLSGAVGNFANLPLSIQDDVCESLGIQSAVISTQVINRDRHAHYLSVLANIASCLEEIATEIRHLQRTEVREAQEYFSLGQKGSSAMPHKRNPISSENICGCARLMRGYMVSSYENIALWHERDISHSSSERVILTDATTLLHYMLYRYKGTLANLIVNKERMLTNIESTNGAIYTQQVLNELIKTEWSREEAYDHLQPLVFKAWDHNNDSSYHLKNLLMNDEVIQKKLTETQIEKCFQQEPFLHRIAEIFQRIFIE